MIGSRLLKPTRLVIAARTSLVLLPCFVALFQCCFCLGWIIERLWVRGRKFRSNLYYSIVIESRKGRDKKSRIIDGRWYAFHPQEKWRATGLVPTSSKRAASARIAKTDPKPYWWNIGHSYRSKVYGWMTEHGVLDQTCVCRETRTSVKRGGAERNRTLIFHAYPHLWR